MFYGHIATNFPVNIEDIRPEIFKLLLDFIYTESCYLPDSDEIYELYYAAEKYMLPLLKKRCLDEVMGNLNISNACKIYEYATLFNIQPLIRRTQVVKVIHG